MNRLRSIANDYLLPLVIGALVLRALIPVGFMPGSGARTSLTASLCNAPATGNAGTEVIRIPDGELPMGTGAMHCDYCLVPMLATACALPALQPATAIDFEPAAERNEAPVHRFALLRAQIPRAPPLA
ncbi:MAG TPA: DUF2946 family protein [Steroidobacteraceae bacterium]|nr:DUF2946 family protein [Steroidobacteraceae bacterium]